MRLSSRATILACALSASFFASAQTRTSAPPAHTLDMTVQQPESVGFSAQRLERLHAAMQSTIDNKQIAGMVTILARHGKVVDYRAYGMRDMASLGEVKRRSTL